MRSHLVFSLEKENRLSLGAGVDGKYAFGLAEPRKKKKKKSFLLTPTLQQLMHQALLCKRPHPTRSSRKRRGKSNQIHLNRHVDNSTSSNGDEPLFLDVIYIETIAQNIFDLTEIR